jgi:hypothetical protein
VSPPDVGPEYQPPARQVTNVRGAASDTESERVEVYTLTWSVGCGSVWWAPRCRNNSLNVVSHTNRPSNLERSEQVARGVRTGRRRWHVASFCCSELPAPRRRTRALGRSFFEIPSDDSCVSHQPVPSSVRLSSVSFLPGLADSTVRDAASWPDATEQRVQGTVGQTSSRSE